MNSDILVNAPYLVYNDVFIPMKFVESQDIIYIITPPSPKVESVAI